MLEFETLAQAELRDAGKNGRERPAPDSIAELLDRQARSTPDAVAIVFGDRAFTYAELSVAADAVARAVSARISGPEPLVGLCIPRGFEMVAGLIGILKAGAAYLPLDPDLPPARIEQVLEEAEPSLLLAPAAQAARFADAGVPILRLEEVQDPRRSVRGGRSAPPRVDRESLAYVLYTSGSTGRPKGVEVTHGSVLNVLQSYRTTPGMDERDVVLALARISFDVSVLEIFLPLSCGARVVLLAESATRDPFELAREIERHGVTVVQGPPALWRSLLEIGWKGDARLRVLSGGEALPRALADRLLPLCREVWNAYGPTETTIVSTLHRVSATACDVPIGRPIANTTLRILDEALEPAPDGGEGELYIGGVGLARGYRGRPDLTAERFRSLAGQARLYRTGDRVRLAPDGELHYLGRSDLQVKLRGFRVELGEIEETLAKHPAVSASAVQVWPDTIGNNALAAYVVLRPGREENAAQIRAHLQARLPDYMVPQRLLLLDRLPLTPNAKLDRSALANPFESASIDRVGGPASTGGATQDVLGAIWRSLLGPVALTPQSDFFDLGGYSLLTVRLLLEVEERFGRSLSLPELLSHSTLGAMAALVEGESGGPISRRVLTLRQEGSRPPLYWLDAGPLLRKALSSIGNDTPVFGLSLAPEDQTALLETGVDVGRLASAVVALLVQVLDRDRPFHLGGWCRWGVVAYEAARQLQDLGYAVRVVVLLDTDLPRRAPPWRGWKARLRSRVAAVLPAASQRREPPPQATFSDLVGLSAARYAGGAYEGAVALIQPTHKRDAARATRDWRAWVRGPVTSYASPGDHETMVRDPHCEALGATIGAALSQ